VVGVELAELVVAVVGGTEVEGGACVLGGGAAEDAVETGGGGVGDPLVGADSELLGGR